MNEATTRPHRRRNPLTGEWVLVSPHRTLRPWQGAVEPLTRRPDVPYDPHCYLCPGNSRAAGASNPDYSGVHVFDNDFPALLDHPESDRVPEHPLLEQANVDGTCRVVCYSPDHSRTFPDLNRSEQRAVIDTWAQQSEELGQRYPVVQIFENKGAMMGCSNPHPHGQIWATSTLPTTWSQEDDHQRAYYRAHGRPLLLEYGELEAQQKERQVVINADWIAVVPYWATWPFETLLLPRHARHRFPELLPGERDTLADALQQLLNRYNQLFDAPFPYSMGWHGAPRDGSDASAWLLHAHFYPPLLRSATVRKFMVGFEMLAEPQRDLTPELAAERLRTAGTRPEEKRQA